MPRNYQSKRRFEHKTRAKPYLKSIKNPATDQQIYFAILNAIDNNNIKQIYSLKRTHARFVDIIENKFIWIMTKIILANNIEALLYLFSIKELINNFLNEDLNYNKNVLQLCINQGNLSLLVTLCQSPRINQLFTKNLLVYLKLVTKHYAKIRYGWGEFFDFLKYKHTAQIQPFIVCLIKVAIDNQNPDFIASLSKLKVVQNFIKNEPHLWFNLLENPKAKHFTLVAMTFDIAKPHNPQSLLKKLQIQAQNSSQNKIVEIFSKAREYCFARSLTLLTKVVSRSDFLAKLTSIRETSNKQQNDCAYFGIKRKSAVTLNSTKKNNYKDFRKNKNFLCFSAKTDKLSKDALIHILSFLGADFYMNDLDTDKGSASSSPQRLG